MTNASTPSPAHDSGGYREVLQVAWPLIISNGSFTLMQFADRVFLARYSATAIQAALPAGILSFTLISCFMALAGYTNTFVAQYHGAGQPERCSRSTAQGVWLALLSWPLIVLLIPAGLALLRFSGHPPAVLAQELSYFTILMAGGISIPLGAAIGGFFTGRGDTRTNMLAQLAGNVANIILDYALIFGRWGLPRLGIEGAAYATVAAGLVAPAILLAIYFGPALNRQFRTRAEFVFEGRLLLRLVRFALPSGLHLSLDVASFAAFVLFTGRMGELSLAVSNIAFSINMVAFMPLLGISIAAGILVGQHQGRRDSAAAERAGWTSLKIGMFYMAAVGLSYLLLPRLYFWFFAQQGGAGLSLEQMLPLGRWLLVMMASWGILDAANLILSGALKGAGDTRFVMLYSTAMGWGLLVPVQWWLVTARGAGIVACWAWLALFVMLLSAGYFLRYRGGRWKSIEVIESVPPLGPTRPGAEAMVVVE